ncbi:ParA family protein [Candidatus Gracilibacteria bacterium]|nr:ParA family protein [Candidatus Gracilibacteria bacterium]NJM89378.1 ParA family protein [Hydrococcus sp. RU_2_2]
MTNQIVLSLLSEAGGVGKTTLAVNLAYEWVCRGHSAVIIDLDSNHSLEDFVGLPTNPHLDRTIVQVFNADFDGQWALQTPFEEEKLQVCQGHTAMLEVAEKMMTRKRREYILAKILKQYSLPHNLAILDCRAGMDLVSLNVLTASTHILIPLDMGVKVKTAARLVQGLSIACEELELNPRPEILGLVPNRYNKGAVVHEEFLSELPAIAKGLNTKLYSPIRTWQPLNNSAVLASPLKKLRPGDPICQVFSEIVDDLEKIFVNK